MKRKYCYCPIVILAVTIAGFVFLQDSNREGTKVAADVPVAASAPQASWIGISHNVNDLIESSDIIIEGRVVGSTPEQRVDLIFTMQEVSISTVYKGDVKEGESISILQTGGSLGEMETHPFQEAPLLDKECDYLLFLMREPGGGYYCLMGGYQGVAQITNNELIFNVSDDSIAKELSGMSFREVTSAVQSKVEI